MVKIQKRVKRIIATLLAAFLVITQVPASMNKVEAANKEYPEYLTIGFAQNNPGIAGDFHYDYQIGKNGKPCADNEKYNDPTKHYIIFEYTTDTSAIAYVRCDVYQKQITPPDPESATFLVTYKDEDGDVLGKEFVNAGHFPKAENMPNVGKNGYWTLEGQENEIKPTEVKISTNTTFVWHKTEPIEYKYTVSYWDGNKVFEFGENISSTEKFTVGEKYKVKDFDGQHDGSDKHHFIGWVTEEGKKILLGGNGNQIINNSVKLNEIKESKEFRDPQNKVGYDGLSEPGVIKLYAIWATDEAIQGAYPLVITYVDDEGNVFTTHEDTIVFEEEYKVVSPTIEGYALVNPEQAIISGRMDSDGETIEVVYSKDNNGDKVPDKFQETVVFAARNGLFKENEKTQIEKVVTLVDTNGKWSEEGSYELKEGDIPESYSVPGYIGEGVWDVKDIVGYKIDKDSKKSFVVSYEYKDKFDVRVEFYFDGKKDENLTETSKEEFGTIFTGAFEKTLEIGGKTYALDKVENNGLRVSTDPEYNVVKVYYEADVKGTDPENPDKGDTIPDKYQVEVKFEAVNGTVSLDRTYVTLVDEEGNYAENGKGFLTEAQIATATANTGYDQDSLVWTPEAPTTDIEISKAMTFVATFEKVEEPVVPVDPTDPPVDPTDPEVPITPEDPDITVTPDPETPAQPTTPEVTTPTDDTPQVVNPVDDTPAQVEDEPVVDVVEDEDTPLANLPEENVDDNQTPLAGLNGGWALVNLISTVVTVLFGLFLLISKKKKEEDKKDDEKQMNVNVDEDEEEIRKRGLFTRILSVVVAIASVIVFFLTEDLTLKMVMTDKWTLLMVVFALVQVVIFFVGRKWKAPKGNKPQQQTAMQ